MEAERAPRPSLERKSFTRATLIRWFGTGFKMGAPKLLLLGIALLANTFSLQSQEALRPPVRDVTPPSINRIYRAPAEVDAFMDDARHFDNIQVQPDGLLRSGDVKIRLLGILLPDRRKICRSDSGTRWACGLSAIGALRGHVQRRSIACRVVDQRQDHLIGVCRVGNSDISLKLIEEGWAEIPPGVTEKIYLDAAKLAKSRNVGLWSDGPSAPR